KAERLTMRAVAQADLVQVRVVEAGEHGHRHDLGLGARRCLSVLHHRAATRGVDGDDGRLQRVDRLYRLRDGIGNVVQLEVEEDGKAALPDLPHAMMAMGAKELQAELYAADMIAHLGDERDRPFQLRCIDGDIQGTAHGWTNVSGASGCGGDAGVSTPPPPHPPPPPPPP